MLAKYQQNVNKTSAKRQQNVNKMLTKCQQNVNQMSTKCCNMKDFQKIVMFCNIEDRETKFAC